MKAPTVLLVYEKSNDLESYGIFLRNSGYETLMYPSASEGTRVLGTESVSLVIVSQGTAAFECRQVIERFMRLYPQAPVLVVAKDLDPHCYLEAIKLGVMDYFVKPDPVAIKWVVDMQMIRRAIAQFTATGRLFCTS